MAATKGLLYELTLNNRGFTDALANSRAAMSSFMGAIGKLGGLAGLAGGLVGAGSAALALKKSIGEAANMETMTAGFEVLLGSVDAAKERMADLANFADRTPFDLPEVAAASRTLETLTAGALSTGKGLTIVGDLAAGVNQSFSEVAVTIGRLYDGLRSGNPAGESLQRLQEVGAVSGEVRNEIEAMQKAGAPGARVWAVAEQALRRYAGSMARLAETWNGKMNTFGDSIRRVYREFGTPLIDSLRPLLSSAIAMSDQLAARARQWGEAVATAVRTAIRAFNDGELGRAAGFALKVAFGNATQFLADKLHGVFEQLRGKEKGIFSGFRKLFEALAATLRSAIRDAITSALENVSIAGRPLMSPKDAQINRFRSMKDDRIAEVRLKQGLNEILGAKGAEGLKGFLAGLATETEEARKALSGMAASASAAAQANVEVARQTVSGNFTKLFLDLLSEFTLKPRLPLAGARSELAFSPVSDRLRAIGHIIQPGGPPGELREREIAMNTKRTADGVEKVFQRLGKQTSAVF